MNMFPSRRHWATLSSLLLLTGCAGFQRSCSNYTAQTYGTNWVVSQMSMTGTPAACWVLHNTSVSNEDKSDGIHWLDRQGQMVHVAGWIDRVQVIHGDYVGAGRQIGITDLTRCTQE